MNVDPRWLKQLFAGGVAVFALLSFAAIASADQVFSNDFETGDTSNWDSSYVKTGNTLVVDSESAHEGSFGLHVATDGVNDDAFVRKGVEATTQIYTKVWMNLIQDVTEGYHQQFLTAASHPDSGKIGSLAIRRTSDAPQNNLFTLAWSGVGPQLWEDTAKDVDLGVWSCVELYVAVSPTEGAMKAWVDGVLVANRQGVDTGSLPITWIRLGADGT